VVVLDRGLRAAHASPSVRQLLGHDPADVVGTPAREYVHPADDSHAAEVVARLLDEPRHTERLVLRVREREDGWRWIEATLTNCLDDPGIRGLVAHLRDVSERVHTEEALRVSEALHRAMVETAQDGIIAMAPDGSTTFANETVARILGRPLEDLYRGSIARLGLDVGEAGAGPSEITYAHPGGGSRVLEVSCRSLTGDHAEALGSLVTVTDVTEARNAETTLRRKALQDPLTGLPNRYLFLDRLETAVARHLRHVGRGTAVLYLDLDDFKPINDAHGHQVGDEVMHEVGRRLAGAVRATDTVGRLGGDEFAIICEDTDEQAAVLVAAKVLAELCRPIPHGSQEYCIGVSIGVAVTPPHEFTDLVRLADAAMYRAKQLGGSRVAVARRQVTTGPGDVAVS
jgi:diguanylate cyclase (GGDEF)-like protein/PAS domain S-box-containing protein